MTKKYFIHTGIVGCIVARYPILSEKPNKKFVELDKKTGEFNFVNGVVPLLIPFKFLSSD